MPPAPQHSNASLCSHSELMFVKARSFESGLSAQAVQAIDARCLSTYTPASLQQAYCPLTSLSSLSSCDRRPSTYCSAYPWLVIPHYGQPPLYPGQLLVYPGLHHLPPYGHGVGEAILLSDSFMYVDLTMGRSFHVILRTLPYPSTKLHL